MEGSPGYGKTTLARNIAVDWGLKADYMNEFKLVIFIYCRDLKGKTIESYVEETFPAMDKGNKKIKLKDWSDIRKDILFILDGLDECSPDDAKEISYRETVNESTSCVIGRMKKTITTNSNELID